MYIEATPLLIKLIPFFSMLGGLIIFILKLSIKNTLN